MRRKRPGDWEQEAEAERARQAAADEAAAQRQLRLAQIADEAGAAADLEDLGAARAKLAALAGMVVW